MRAFVHELRLLAVALQFLTRIPVPLRRFDPQWLHHSARHFPAVGMLVGAFGACVLAGASLIWPAPVAVLASMAATAWLTGGFHEDGLADTCDGLGGAVSRERALEIMKDSRLGSYGALGLAFTLALKAAALVALAAHSIAVAAGALVFAHAASRACAVVLMGALPYAGDVDHAKAKPMARPAGALAPAVALGWTLALAAAVALAGSGAAAARVLPDELAAIVPVALPVALAAALLATVAVTALCGRWLRRRLGGYTGDTLGATQQWTELSIYLALAALLLPA
ncbi:MAG: adenosylcobinamide-GDP ribazoletransferase [Lautropia sp. SCN 69-89]|nr:MAG: adenosylcobinamide-GDP ribazoletransferase [Lautropia sp. SCN 69-89]